MTAETLAATTETSTPEPDGREQVESPGAESAPAVTDPDEGREKPESGISKRIDELTRNWRETERERDYLRQLLLQQQQPKEPERPVAREEPAEPEPKTLADFQYDEKAYAKYVFVEAQKAAKREAEAIRREFREEQSTKTRESAHADFRDRITKWAKAEKIEDFDVIFDPLTPITESMADIVMGSEKQAALAYYLAKNRDVAAQIARLPERQQAYELGRIEATKLAKPAAPKVSEAPPPAPRIDGSGATVSNVKADDPASDKLSDVEWTRMRNKQEAARRARRFART